MGFIHDTGSKIFGIETRSESAYLIDMSEDTAHLSIPQRRGVEVRDNIVANIMKTAGEYFAKGDSAEAVRLKKVADIVNGTAIRPDDKRYSVEATYEWIAELVKFATTDRTMMGHLAELPKSNPPEAEITKE